METKTITINEVVTFSDIEKHIEDIGNGEQYKIRLPYKLNTSGSLGVEVALIQLIGTWLYTGDYKKIFHSYTKMEDLNSDSFGELCSSMYGIMTLALADEIWATGGEPIARSQALAPAVDIMNFLRKKDYSKAFKSRYFGVPCIRRDSYDKEFDVPLYNNKNIINEIPFTNLIINVLNSNFLSKTKTDFLSKLIDPSDLGRLIWELFSNTHDHGREDKKGNVIRRNLRGIVLQQQEIHNKYFENWLDGSKNTPLVNLRQDWSNISESKNLQMLDISAIDFGEGYAGLLSNIDIRDVGEDEEIFLTQKCMNENWSRTGRPNRGSGITKALECACKYRGFIRIRTGRVVVEKYYSKDSPSWKINREDLRFTGNYVRGVSFHISIPLIPFNSNLGTPY